MCWGEGERRESAPVCGANCCLKTSKVTYADIDNGSTDQSVELPW